MSQHIQLKGWTNLLPSVAKFMYFTILLGSSTAFLKNKSLFQSFGSFLKDDWHFNSIDQVVLSNKQTKISTIPSFILKMKKTSTSNDNSERSKSIGVSGSDNSNNVVKSPNGGKEVSKTFIEKLKKFTDKKIALSSYERKQLFHSLLYWIPELSPTETAQLTWCVGTLQLFSHQDIVVISDMLFDRLSMDRHKLSSEDMAISLIGFARMGVQFSLITSVSFLDCLPHTLRNMDNQQLANSVWSLGKLGVKWNVLSLKCQKALSEAITLNCKKMAPQGVANTIQGNTVMI